MPLIHRVESLPMAFGHFQIVLLSSQLMAQMGYHSAILKRFQCEGQCLNLIQNPHFGPNQGLWDSQPKEHQLPLTYYQYPLQLSLQTLQLV